MENSLHNAPPIIINAAITGIVPKRKDNPYVPLFAEEIIQDALACAEAGASVIHIHARDNEQQPAWNPDIYAEIIGGIRKFRSDLILCVSTSGRVFNEFEKRSAVLDLNGDLKPEMASLTLGSMNFIRGSSINTPELICALAEKMKSKGIKPELEFFEPGMINYARYLTRKGFLGRPWTCNMLLGSLGTSPATLTDLCHMVQSLPVDCVWGAAGIGRFQLKMNTAAILMGGHVRVGLEDNLYYDSNKRVLADNCRLIKRIVRLADEFERPVATTKQARPLLGLD